MLGIMMSQCTTLLAKKCTILVSDAENGGGCACEGAGGKWENSVPPSPFCCKPKITLSKSF